MDKIIEYMIAEDEGFGDITSDAVIDDEIVTAHIISKDKGILAGIDIIKEIFTSRNIEVLYNLADGSRIDENDLLITVRGYAKSILLLERSVLNLLMRMSGIASISDYYVNLVKGYDVIVAGTRKTSPAIGKFDKLALRIGGADTHRFSLDDMVLIKDNHIAFVGTPVEALEKAQTKVSFSKKIEIEVENLDDAIECVNSGADIVMLDNMTPQEVGKVLDKLNELNIRKNSLIEVSGGINDKNIIDYAKLDIDIISLGVLTHSVRSLNFSLRLGD